LYFSLFVLMSVSYSQKKLKILADKSCDHAMMISQSLYVCIKPQVGVYDMSYYTTTTYVAHVNKPHVRLGCPIRWMEARIFLQIYTSTESYCRK
jgi:hypothetical protein